MAARKKGISIIENKKCRIESNGLNKDIEMGLDTELSMDSEKEEIMCEANAAGLGLADKMGPKNVKGGFRKRSSPRIMSTISWNYRGLGIPWVVQFLNEIVLQKKLSFIFLCEILCKKNKMESIRNLLGFEGMVTVETEGHNRGIAFMWRNKDEASLRSLSKNHIDHNITIQGWQKFRLTYLYDEPDRAKRKETWQLIRNLATTSDLPWVLIGDMNNVLSQIDKKRWENVFELAYSRVQRGSE